MRRKVTRQEASRFIEAFGAEARMKAEEAARQARRRQDARRATFYSDVARCVERLFDANGGPPSA